MPPVGEGMRSNRNATGEAKKVEKHYDSVDGEM